MKSLSETEIRYAMVGGGLGSFIGPIHRAALQMLSPNIRLVSGCFSSKKENNIQSAKSLRLDTQRLYSDFQNMAEKEAELPESQRPHFVVIVTPNHLHFPVAKEFLSRGISVFCEKPMTKTSEEAEEIMKMLRANSKLRFGIAYGYTGYPMVKEARALIRSGRIGKIRKFYVAYHQSWLSEPIERQGQKQALWRTDPSESGSSLCLGDIGSHAENLLSYLTGLEIQELSADLRTVVSGRKLDDDAMILLRMKGGVTGVLVASQVLTGELNHLTIRIYGDQGALLWSQENPETLTILEKNGSKRILSRGISGLSPAVTQNSYLPSGHPEGLIEAFSNNYRAFIEHLLKPQGKEEDFDYPKCLDGVRGMKFIERSIQSSKSSEKWTNFSS